jgi:hypothetical protein
VNLERIAMQRAAEQLESGSWREHEPEWTPPTPHFTYTGVCAMCQTKKITARNKSRICRNCHHNLSPGRRRAWLALVRSQDAARAA